MRRLQLEAYQTLQNENQTLRVRIALLEIYLGGTQLPKRCSRARAGIALIHTFDTVEHFKPVWLGRSACFLVVYNA